MTLRDSQCCRVFDGHGRDEWMGWIGCDMMENYGVPFRRVEERRYDVMRCDIMARSVLGVKNFSRHFRWVEESGSGL